VIPACVGSFGKIDFFFSVFDYLFQFHFPPFLTLSIFYFNFFHFQFFSLSSTFSIFLYQFFPFSLLIYFSSTFSIFSLF